MAIRHGRTAKLGAYSKGGPGEARREAQSEVEVTARSEILADLISDHD